MTFVNNSLYSTGEMIVEAHPTNRRTEKPISSVKKVFDAFDEQIEKFENKCTDLAIYPIIGTVTGVTKALFGIVRLVTALTLAIFSSLFCATEEGRNFTTRCAKEALYGLGDIAHGTLLAVPLVGSLVSWATMDQRTIYRNITRKNWDGRPNEYVPYHIAFIKHVKNRFKEDTSSIASMFQKKTNITNAEIVD